MKMSFGKEVLQYGILIGIVYQLYQTAYNIYPVLFIKNAFIDLAITLILVLLYVVSQNKKHESAAVLVLHIIAVTGFSFFWVNHGGLAGTVPAFLCLYIGFIVMVTLDTLRWFALITLFATVSVYLVFPEKLGMASYHDEGNRSLISTAIDFLVIGGIIAIFILFVKRKFLFYRGRASKRFEQLNHIASTLHNQNTELATREEETRAINENLETLVEARTRELENQNRALAEFAFINAHMLRGPVCRIQGLLHLMERDPNQYPANQIDHLRKVVNDIDAQITVINKVVS